MPDQGEPFDEMWWVKRKLREENLAFPLPGTLALRKEAEQALAAARRARSEDDVRAILTEINEKIVEGHRKAMSGPPLTLMPYDIEEFLAEWRASRPPEPEPAEPEPEPPAPRRRPLFRFFMKSRRER
ncbi:DUF1992 domain-containing protein [Thermocatellispora tengchongensis]|uniref:DUF1992 domain-containing protein n=1 Tax=Thermocatellispora tengchongensis TaxID=1073253 RepID=UPI0036306766